MTDYTSPIEPDKACLELWLKQTRKDLLILVLRLMGEDRDTFSPEVADVMDIYSQTAMQQFEELNNE